MALAANSAKTVGMKQFLITVAGVFLGLVLFVVGVPILLIAGLAGAAKPAHVSGHNVLVLDLREGLSDQEPTRPFDLFTGRTQSVLGIEQALRRAQDDAAVGGLLVRLPEGGMAPASADELRGAFKRFRAAGKPILAYSQGLYADGMAPSTYELAAASGNIWMQPSSSFQVTGLARQDVFFKRFFDQHGVKADYQQRYEFKNAVNPYLYGDYTPSHRESELGWMGSVYRTVLTSVAADRAVPLAEVRARLEAGPWSAEDAKTKGLVDAVGELHDAERAILAKAGSGAKLTPFRNYAETTPSTFGGDGATVAVIGAEGAIMTGPDGGGGPLGGGETVRSDAVAKAFYAAIDDEDVKAIVFRVSSPGGSDTASEQILSAVRAATAAGKPVVISMGAYAASGGYWISSQASEIVAQPTTLTGSIGVFGGKFALGEALGKFGVDMRGVKVGGDFADAYSSAGPMSAGQRAAFSALIDKIYDGFVARVATGRKLTPARVREIAKGRVWTGEQAKSLGLVDSLGGFYDAVDRAKALAGIKGKARLETFGDEPGLLNGLRHMLGASARVMGVMSRADDAAQTPGARAMLDAAGDAGLRARGATVLAPRVGW